MAKNKVVFGGIVQIDLTDASLGQSDGAKILSGESAYGKDGEKITGSCTYDADTSDADASASEILLNKTAYVNGNKLTGSMPNNGGVTGTISDLSTPYTIPAGYHDGSGTAAIDSTEIAKIIPSNILEGVTILGVTGTVEPSSDVHIESSKTVTPYTTQQTVLPSSGYDALAQVVVSPIYYNEVANAYGTTVEIGTVAPTP